MRKPYRWISIAAFIGALSGCASATPGAPPHPSVTSAAATPGSSGSVSPRSSGASGGGSSGQPVPASSGSTAVAGNIVITRSGGLIGISQNLVISPDGRWTLTDRRAGTTRHGQLMAADHAHLNALVTAPAFAVEAKRPPAGMSCNDGIAVVISVGELTAHDSGCGNGNQPAVDAVIAFVTSVIGW